MPITLDGTNGITTPMYNGSITANAVTPSVNMKNRIINGAMVIDQRNAGASVTVNSGTRIYSLDRFFGYGESSDGVFTIQQSSTAPAGFTNSAIITTTTADASVGASQYYLLGHSVEGFNSIADLNWGTANAKTVTLSFWVRSSLTGQFGGSLTNNGNARSYPFSYTISAANTWEQKSVTIAGDTSGTWLTTNGVGINIYWDLGCGSSNIGTAGSWSGSSFFGATGDTKLISTNGATFYITGVQLEVGSTATSFDYRPYGTELALCQRYYYLHVKGNSKHIGRGNYYSTTHAEASVYFPVTMRTTTTLVATSGTDYYVVNRSGGSDTLNSLTLNPETSESCASLYNNSEASGTSGVGGNFCTNNSSASIAFSAEL